MHKGFNQPFDSYGEIYSVADFRNVLYMHACLMKLLGGLKGPSLF